MMDGVDMIGLIAGVTVLGAILLCAIIIGLVLLCRRRLHHFRKKDRSSMYILPEPSLFGSLHGPDLLGHGYGSSLDRNGYLYSPRWSSEKVLPTSGEIRHNPLSANAYYGPPAKQPISIIALPEESRMYGDRLTGRPWTSEEIMGGLDNRAFFLSLYEHLHDTVHMSDGRPLYVSARQNYHPISNYFHIVGKTRHGDYVVKPKKGVPNRPSHAKHHKKNTPPIKAEDKKKLSGNSRESQDRHKFSKGVFATPFGVVEKVTPRYLNGSHLERTNFPSDDEPTRETKGMNGGPKPPAPPLHPLANRDMDEQLFANIIKKHNVTDAVDIVDKHEVHTQAKSPAPTPTHYIRRDVKGEGYESRDIRRDRRESSSTLKSFGITEQFKFLEQYDLDDEKF